MSADDHYQDILRVISAMSRHASKVNVIMPFLYQSRQHKKNGRESLDCAMALRQLENLRVKNILTVDVHDTSMDNVLGAFTNYPLRKLLMREFIKDVKDLSDIIVISPDGGARARAKYVADKLGDLELGVFEKRRDFNNIIDGHNQILEHEYFGNDLNGKNAFIVDDMISSGESMLKTDRYLKERGVNKIYIMVNFALFEKM